MYWVWVLQERPSIERQRLVVFLFPIHSPYPRLQLRSVCFRGLRLSYICISTAQYLQENAREKRLTVFREFQACNGQHSAYQQVAPAAAANVHHFMPPKGKKTSQLSPFYSTTKPLLQHNGARLTMQASPSCSAKEAYLQSHPAAYGSKRQFSLLAEL